jgi:hypothetical protein
MEQMMLAVQQQQRTQLQLEKATSAGTTTSISVPSPPTQANPVVSQGSQQHAWDNNSYGFARRDTSVSSANSVASAVRFQHPGNKLQVPPPTLPPHPKQKQLPLGGSIPEAMNVPPDRFNSLRGISTLSGLNRGLSVQSTDSAVLMRTSWEDKFFSALMLDNNDQSTDATLQPTPVAGAQNNMVAPATVSNRSSDDVVNKDNTNQDDMSDVSNS